MIVKLIKDSQKIIYEKMIEELYAHGFQPTTQNKLDFLLGLQEAWDENRDRSLEKSLCQLALRGLIIELYIKKIKNA